MHVGDPSRVVAAAAKVTLTTNHADALDRRFSVWQADQTLGR